MTPGPGSGPAAMSCTHMIEGGEYALELIVLSMLCDWWHARNEREGGMLYERARERGRERRPPSSGTHRAVAITVCHLGQSWISQNRSIPAYSGRPRRERPTYADYIFWYSFYLKHTQGYSSNGRARVCVCVRDCNCMHLAIYFTH